jgi:hypothetical protein
MTNTTPLSPSASAKPSKARRSQAADAEVVRAKLTLAALPPLLAGIATKDKNAAKVRIDKAWVTQYANVIAATEQAEGARAVAKVDLKAATSTERETADDLAVILIDVRELVATHNPDDLAAQQAYGRGEKIDPRRTGATIAVAQGFLQAWSGKWKEPAVDAGVTQATMDQIETLMNELSAADVGQHGVMTTNADGTVGREASLSVLREMNAFAARVVANVFGKASSQALSLADPRPLASRGSVRKAATKAKHAAAKTAKKAKKTAKLAKPGERARAAKGRAKRAAVAARAKAVAAKAAPAAKSAKKAKAKRAK